MNFIHICLSKLGDTEEYLKNHLVLFHKSECGVDRIIARWKRQLIERFDGKTKVRYA